MFKKHTIWMPKFLIIMVYIYWYHGMWCSNLWSHFFYKRLNEVIFIFYLIRQRYPKESSFWIPSSLKWKEIFIKFSLLQREQSNNAMFYFKLIKLFFQITFQDFIQVCRSDEWASNLEYCAIVLARLLKEIMISRYLPTLWRCTHKMQVWNMALLVLSRFQSKCDQLKNVRWQKWLETYMWFLQIILH